jgi:hypothetical protein
MVSHIVPLFAPPGESAGRADDEVVPARREVDVAHEGVEHSGTVVVRCVEAVGRPRRDRRAPGHVEDSQLAARLAPTVLKLPTAASFDPFEETSNRLIVVVPPWLGRTHRRS